MSVVESERMEFTDVRRECRGGEVRLFNGIPVIEAKGALQGA